MAVTFADLLNPEKLITLLDTWALVGVCLIVFVECGLLLFFLPGDSLLFTAGLFIAAGAIKTPLWLACIVLIACAMLGNVVGYWIGHRVGPALFNRPDSKIFKQEYVDKTHEFFEKYGARAIVLARFVPIVRTFITLVAGVGRMDAKKFFTYSFIGGIFWAGGLTVLGYFLGSVPIIRENLELTLIGIVFLSIVPIIFEYLKARREKKALNGATQVMPRIED